MWCTSRAAPHWPQRFDWLSVSVEGDLRYCSNCTVLYTCTSTVICRIQAVSVVPLEKWKKLAGTGIASRTLWYIYWLSYQFHHNLKTIPIIRCLSFFCFNDSWYVSFLERNFRNYNYNHWRHHFNFDELFTCSFFSALF